MKKSNSSAINFRQNSQDALLNKSLRLAIKRATEAFKEKRLSGIQGVPFEQWREEASDLKIKVIENLSGYVDQFAANATRRGAIVQRAKDAAHARTLVGDILHDHGVRNVVKAKSMVTEEIHLNKYLGDLGFQVVETDLGEYIVQIAGETPSHILAPALHKTRDEVGRLFCDKLGCDFSDDPSVLTDTARKILRPEFIKADAGICGANFFTADTGSVVLFTNEGNGRMVTTLPPLLIVVTSIEKALPSIKDLPLFMRLLPRSATGQTLSSYFSIISGDHLPGLKSAVRRLHVILLDNCRSEIATGPFREILKCVRCGACMNVCPVYGVVGGHAYESTYPGPMGIVLTCLLEGLEASHPLLDATTLCGACSDVCPVKVPLVKMLYELRELKIDLGYGDYKESLGMTGFSIATMQSRLFQTAQKVSRFFWSLGGFVSPVTFNRLPKPVKRTFRRRMS
ncbi:MAG: lactate utilization protein B [Pseudomonadota bacterium]